MRYIFDLDALEAPYYSAAFNKVLIKLTKLEKEFPGLIQEEFFDHIDVMADSARAGKYPLNNWLEPDGKRCARRDNFESIERHYTQAAKSSNELDKDSGRHPALHAAARLMMAYTRDVRGIRHSLDTVDNSSKEK